MASRLSSLLIVGGDSLIGRALALRCVAEGIAVATTTRRPEAYAPDRPPLDLAADAAGWPELPRADAAVLCAAVTAIAACERDPAASRRVNVEATTALARRAHAAGMRVVLPSTSLVFDGEAPHVPEAAVPSPRTEYGHQKAAAERGVLALGAGAVVVRLGKVLAPGLALFDGWIAALRAGRPIEPFEDMVLAAVAADLAARALLAVATAGDGVYHLTAARDVTYAELARHIAARVGATQALVRPVRGRTPGGAVRHTTLETSRLSREHAIAAPDPYDAVDALFLPAPTPAAQAILDSADKKQEEAMQTCFRTFDLRPPPPRNRS